VIERFASRDAIPPQNLEAEQSVLGAMLLDRLAVERAREILQPEDFYRDAHRRIFEAMWDLSERSEPVDLVTLSDTLRVRQALDQIGGVSYLATLADLVPSTSNVEYYARIVEQKATLRRLIEASNRITGWAYEQPDEVDSIVDRAEQEIFRVGRRQMGSSFYPLKSLVSQGWDDIEKAYEEQSEVTGVDTGYTRFNFMTSGLQPSDLVIIAARPSMGKTAFSLGMAVNAAKSQPMAVAVFSLEMSKEQLTVRMITSEAKVNAHRLRTGYLREGDWARIGEAVSRLAELRVYVDDSSDVTPVQMRAKCRRLAAEENLGLVVVDYLQLIRGNGRDENRNQEITTIARQLKAMAKELNVPVVALSQLSRAVERREDKRPMLSDLRESGSIEAEADIVAFLYREDYYKRKEEASTGGGAQTGSERSMPGEARTETTEVIIAKHRNGPVGTVKLMFLPEYARFEDMAEHEEAPYEGG
jgi:replicative DNA helicase